jgi:hypothetical protein
MKTATPSCGSLPTTWRGRGTWQCLTLLANGQAFEMNLGEQRATFREGEVPNGVKLL